MSLSFRPRLEALDARELPAVTAFSFALTSGTVVSGTFDYADAAVDPARASQEVPVTDLSVALNSEAAVLPVQLGVARAAFAGGQLQGLSLTAVAVAGSTAAFVNVSAGSLRTIPNLPEQHDILPALDVTLNVNWQSLIDKYHQGRRDLILTEEALRKRLMYIDEAQTALELTVAAAGNTEGVLMRYALEAAAVDMRNLLSYWQMQTYDYYIYYQHWYQQVNESYWLLKERLPQGMRDDLMEPPGQLFVPLDRFGPYPQVV